MVKIISFLQTFTIILVVVGHSFVGKAAEEPFVEAQTWIYSFHMPMFMLLSGWLFSYKNKDNLSGIKWFGKEGFVVGKIKRLLVPYFLLSTVAFFVKAQFSQYAVRPIGFTFDDYLHQLIYPYDNAMGHMWFLPTLFFIFLIVVCINKLLKKIPMPILQGIMLVVFLIVSLFFKPLQIKILNVSGILYYLFYFQLGVMIERYGIFERIEKSKIHIGAFVLFIISILLLLVPMFFGQRQVAALVGIGFSVCLGYIYLHHNSHFLDHLNGASYTIYLFSWFPQVFCYQVLMKFLDVDGLLLFLLSCITGLYFSWFIYLYETKGKKTVLRTCLRFINGMKPS